MQLDRRQFLGRVGLGLGAASVSTWLRAEEAPRLSLYADGQYRKLDSATRQFHLSVTNREILSDELLDGDYRMPDDPNAIEMKAERMIDLWKEAGITDLWICPYIYGRYIDREEIDNCIRRAIDAGMNAHFVTVPIGHPNVKFTPEIEARWKPFEHFSGMKGYGCSCHVNEGKDCVKSVRTLADRYGACDVCFDDDYRFSLAPNLIGGCVCPDCKAEFMRKSGISEAQWDELIASLKENNDTKLVRSWIDMFCDRMSRFFKESKEIAPEVDLGVMVMGMGSEKAGLRLDDYRGSLFRVGEWMFTNEQYDDTKNKTIELFSSLFHRRFVRPGRALSETTIIQPLRAQNYVSKLSISTLSDVRNTLFMCPVPASYWGLIAPRMKREKSYHDRLIGSAPRGPFKHFWGVADRYMAGYDAYSLFLALGVPFEVCDSLPKDGWVFLGDASAREMERGELVPNGAKHIARFASSVGRFDAVPETFDELFAFRKTLLDDFQKNGVPYVEEESPVVLRWYPDANAFYLWNIEDKDKVVHLRKGGARVAVEMKALDSALVVEEGQGAFNVL